MPLEIQLHDRADRFPRVGRAQLIRRLDLAVEIARVEEPRLVLRLPAGDPFRHA